MDILIEGNLSTIFQNDYLHVSDHSFSTIPKVIINVDVSIMI